MADDSPNDPDAAPDASPADESPRDGAGPAPAPRRRRWWRRVTIASVTALLLLTGAAALGLHWQVRRPLPHYGGELKLAGLTAPVTVHRDGHGVPQLYGQTRQDLFRAQGYVHAQDRFWEMDFRRHVTSGRLAELFGADQVPTDTYLRTLGWRRVAEREWNLISPESRTYLTAYAAGVNEWLRQHGDGEPSGEVSLEYALLGLRNDEYRIEEWSPVDSLAWLKAMAWDLRSNLVEETERATLLAGGLPRDQIEQLFPAYPFDRNPAIVPAGGPGTAPAQGGAGGGAAPPHEGAGGGAGTDLVRAAGPALDALHSGLARLPALLGAAGVGAGAGIGSNSWVVAGSRTASGRPILANDPHLGPSAPGIWFQIGLHCDCGFDIAGYSFSGMPGVVIGHNDRIAWGFTNLGPDVADLYLEKVDDADRYLVDGVWRDLDVRRETIRVAGGEPVTVTVRATGNGPLLSDASTELSTLGSSPPVAPPLAPDGATGGEASPAARDAGYAVALRWTALDPGRSMDALFALNAARDWAMFRDAVSLFEVPAQNIVYADVEGNIGYQAPGRIPVRGAGDGKWPAPGWDSSYAWRGWIPFAELPNALNPAQGYLVTANQAVAGPGYPHHLTDDWSYGYRARRITELITGSPGRISVADAQRMQFDSHHPLAPTLVPLLSQARLSGDAVRAQALLRDWDFQQPAEGADGSAQGRSSAAAAYFNAVWRHLLTRTFDELPDGHRPGGDDRWFEVMRALLAAPEADWWDDRATPAREAQPEILRAAMRDAAEELTDRLGDDPAGWRWGELHVLHLRNQPFGESGVAAVEWLFNVGPVAVSGGSDAVNATGWNAAEGYEVTSVPSMRMVVDLADLNESRWVNLIGQSGHAYSPHYRDQLDLWRTGRTLPMRWSRDSIEREARHTQTLTP